jgi:serine/threonine protein kinase
MSDYQPSRVVPGTVYQVIRLLGQGGMGTVYEVEDTTVGKRYVLKTLHAHLRDRKEIAARIGNEARILAQLSHANIVEVVTAGVTGDSLKLPYFVMQKLNGHTLRAVLSAKGRLPTETAYSIAIDLLDALDHAHSFGVIHRDVKPENIFLHRGPSDAHQTKLLDFGVMRMLSSDKTRRGSHFVGTLRYAPPEQLQGGDITQRTDLYAAGLVLYEMLVGAGPFDYHTTDRDVANAHIEEPPPPLSSRIKVSPKLEALVMSALEKDPSNRPRDAFTFAANLRELSLLAMSARSSSLSGQTLPAEPLLLGMSAPPPSSNPGADKSPSRPKGARTVPSDRNAATTTGAISSHASAIPIQRRAWAVMLGIAAVAIIVGGAIVAAGWRREQAAGTAPSAATQRNATPSPDTAPTMASTTASTPTTASTTGPTPAPTPTTLTATPNAATATRAAPPANAAPHADAPPPPSPTESPSSRPRQPRQPQLPGPGF